MFTLDLIVKRGVTETVLDKASVHTRNATFGTISAPEQDYFAQVLKDFIPETQRCICSCSHCTGSVSATLRFTSRYSVNIALCYLIIDWLLLFLLISVWGSPYATYVDPIFIYLENIFQGLIEYERSTEWTIQFIFDETEKDIN